MIGGARPTSSVSSMGRRSRFTDQSASPTITTFVTAAARAGGTGIGAGVGYMGNRTIHVGFGTSPSDRTRLTWGAGGRSANAPGWLRNAAGAGWAAPAPPFAPPVASIELEAGGSSRSLGAG